MKEVFQLEKHTSVAGGKSVKTLKTFTTLGASEHWLLQNGYRKISDRWENPKEQDDRNIFDVWVYIKIECYEVE